MKATNSSFEETFAFDAATLKDERFKLHKTKDGYIACMPRVARTGIQEYLGVEMGVPDMDKVLVYRPESEVMDHDAVVSLAGKPVTIEHPDHPVTAKTWKRDAVGYVGREILRDGEFVRVPLHLMDADAINEMQNGRSQLSVGYTAVVLWGDGVTDKGEPYHAKPTQIRANHAAITHAARGGPQLRMGDGKQERKMATRTIVIDNVPVDLDERDAPVIERRLAQLEKEIATAQTALGIAQTTIQTDSAKHATELTNATTALQAKDAEIATLKAQLEESKVTPEKLDELADARAAVKVRAKALLDSVVIDKKSDADIRRQVVNAKLGDVPKNWPGDQVTASFNTLTLSTNDSAFNGLHHVVEVIRGNELSGGGDQVGAAYKQYEADIQNRWKTAGARNQ